MEVGTRYLRLIFQKAQALGCQIGSLFPCSLFFCVVAPLNFEEPYSLSSGGLVFLVEDFDLILYVGEVGLQLQGLLRYSFLWNSQTLLELRDMENVVEGCQVVGQLYSVGDGSAFFRDLVGSDISRSKFPFYSKSLDAFGWGNTQIYVVVFLEG